MNPRKGPAAPHLRLLFEEIVDLEPDERAARLGRLDPNDPDVARVVRLLEAHDHATQRLGALEFLRAPDAVGRDDSSFDAAAAFVPSYTIEGELDGSGMSRVFFGHDTKLGRKIVAKVLPPELGAEVSLGRFQQEIKLAAQLRHPNIVPLLEAGEAAGCLYYTMPFIEGESLRDRLGRDGNLPVPVALRFATEIADALAYAHGLGVVHCDIKPGNVLIDSGHAVVTDFGIARALSDTVTATVTRSGTVIGTPAYMSPEQSSADGVVDVRTDVYSLGCVLHEMLYGSLPFGGVVAFTPTEHAAGVRVPARVRAIVARAMARRSADRFQSAQAMREALLAEAAPRLTPRAAWSIAVGFVVLVLGVGLALRPRTDHSFAGPQAQVRQVTKRGDVRLAAISPGGEYVAFVTSDTILRVGEIGTGAQVILNSALSLGQGPHWRIRQISWSPDGSVLYYSPEGYLSVNAIPKVGPWRMVIVNPLLAGPVHDVAQQLRSSEPANRLAQSIVWHGNRWASGFAISPVDSSLAVWVAPNSFTDRNGAVIEDRNGAIIVHLRLGPLGAEVIERHLPGPKRDRTDTIAVRLDMLWAMISFSPNGRWLAACGGSRGVLQGWRLALIAVNGTTQKMLDSSAGTPRESCGVMWNARGDSLHVWPKPPGTGAATYPIDDASGTALGPPVAFRLPSAPAGERTDLTLSTDQSRLAYVEHRTRRYVAVVELGAGIEVRSQDVNVGAADPSRPEISPAGDRFAYVITGDSGSAIYTEDVRGGEPRRLSRDYREGLSGVRWSDDGTRIATLTRRDSQKVILVLDASGSELMTVRPRHTIVDTSMWRPSFDWAARSTGIMYLAADSETVRPDIWLIDLASGRERLLLPGTERSSSHYPSLPVWSPDGKSILNDSLEIRINMRDAMTGAKQAVNGIGVPLVWKADGTFFSERINPDGTTSIWRSSVIQPSTLYAHLGKECKLVSMDRQAHRAVCQVYSDESDVFVVTRR